MTSILAVLCLWPFEQIQAKQVENDLGILPYTSLSYIFQPKFSVENHLLLTRNAVKPMKVHFIDVGQGDGILIQSPNGKTMLVDGGPKEASTLLVSYLKSLNIKQLDYVVATHPDADHIGGLIDVLQNFQVGQFINSGKVHTTETYEELLQIIFNRHIQYTEPTEGSNVPFDYTLQVAVLHINANAEDINDAAIVLKVLYNQVSFLLMSDVDVQIESEIAAKYNVSSTILKAGHHGSDTSSSRNFLMKVHPKVTVLSYGKDNSYGHPKASVVKNIMSTGSKIYATAQSGTIIMTTDGFGYTVNEKTYSGNGDTKPTIQSSKVIYNNCTELRKVYPKGVSSSHPAYQNDMDRDKDLWHVNKYNFLNNVFPEILGKALFFLWYDL